MERTPSAKASGHGVWELQVCVTEDQVFVQEGKVVGGHCRGWLEPSIFCCRIRALSCSRKFVRWGMAESYQCLEKSHRP